jgi:hypothetical protein
MAMVWRQDAIDAKVIAAASRAVVGVALAVVETGNGLIAGPPKTGRIYKKTNPRRTHQASAPGQPPAADLGALMASASVIVPKQGDLFQVTAKANWSTNYARGLELGTDTVDPRPYARPSMDVCAPLLVPGMRAELNKEFG